MAGRDLFLFLLKCNVMLYKLFLLVPQPTLMISFLTPIGGITIGVHLRSLSNECLEYCICFVDSCWRWRHRLHDWGLGCT